MTLSFQDMSAAVATGQAFGFPIADTIKQNLTFASAGSRSATCTWSSS